MNSKKKTIILTVLGVITLIVFAVGVTYAYFTAQGNNVSQADVNVKTATTDSLIFTTGNNISFTADQTTFAKGMGNKEGSSYAKATLKANNSTNSATANYYVYLDITNNTFKHTTTAKTGELILTVIDPEGSPVTSINGLDYVTVNGISGFDITEATSLITIVDNHEIVSTGTKEEKWDITITLVNLDEDQSANAGSSFTAKLKIQKEKEENKTLATTCLNKALGSCISSNYKLDTAIYYHDPSSIEGVGDNSYRYIGGDFVLTEKAKVNYESIADNTVSSNEGLVKFYCDGTKSFAGRVCSKDLSYYYTLAYDDTNTQYASYQEVLNKAVEDGYLTKDNVKNFVCFGTNETNCPVKDIYRIIGVFDNQIKLIKYDYATKEQLGEGTEYGGVVSKYFRSSVIGSSPASFDGYYWNKYGNGDQYGSGDWTTSAFNKDNLNTNFLNYLGEEWSNKISPTKYIISGAESGYVEVQGSGYTQHNPIVDYDTKEMYNKEIKSASLYTDLVKIALPYASDYGLAANKEYWSTELQYYNDKKIMMSNWMSNGFVYYTISKDTRVKRSIFDIGYNMGTSAATNAYPAFPTFYLNSDVKLISGTGTLSDPYRIS